ncbi:PKD domain-containing protein [Ferruginibacter sp. SUN002]|uniref:PKD domain-containing protein n=1 Tax=Ferruginibacter sp. SUN002 TaxID=2937789 RepID=UPI003D36B073
MKKILFIILLLFSLTDASARHIKGGFFTYKYLGPGIANPANLRYKVTLTVFMECYPSPGQLNNQITFTFFNARTKQQVANPSVRLTSEIDLLKSKDEPCIAGDQRGCYYTVVVYELDNYEIPVSVDGYIISYQRCCRIEEMDNIVSSGDIGNTYTITIPGTGSPVPDANKNNSPDFLVNDTIVVCQNSFFSYPFKAFDSDGDSLTYAFCDAYAGAAPPPGDAEPNPAVRPPYFSVPYKSPFNSTNPMGSKVSINAVTGMISGVAPSILITGEYVVTVCVSEYRNGVNFAQSRKELHIRVRDCDPLQAFLNPKPVTCDGFTLNFSNDVATPTGVDHVWNFGDPASGLTNTSTNAKPTHTYSDSGVYVVKLKVSVGGLCADSTSIPVKVYPGFFPGFTTDVTCIGQPVQFTDTTKTNYGTVTGWRWDFGNTSTINDTSRLSAPTYTYPAAEVYKNVSLIVSNTFGCVDTVYRDITVHDTPSVRVTGPTLICWTDTVQLTATGNGNVSWSPNYMINDIDNKTPFVSPDLSTRYVATLTDLNGCRNNSSVFIDVRRSITVDLLPDTTICKGDAITLFPTSEALEYLWSPAAGLDDINKKNPTATPLSSTIYKVRGNVGKCEDEAEIAIKVVPYPQQQKSKDTSTCFPLSTKIYASGGSFYKWNPTTFLSDPNIPNPSVLFPTSTINYIATVTDTLGCPKPTYDTFTVRVLNLIADAGPRDTAIVLGELLYLQGGIDADSYSWSPATGLDNTSKQNPVANITSDIQYILSAQTNEGCKASDTINVKVYRVPADLYVPTGFSPNGDGLNDLFKPILLGVRKLNFFNVYNRWGQLVYSVNHTGYNFGWDGTYKGIPQAAGTFVWRVEGISYEGKFLSKQGTVVLVR